MSQQQQIITDMTMGELSPRMMGRFDLQAYFKGLKELTNFFPFFPGGVTYRPGFTHIGLTKDIGKVRLVPFILSQNFAYVLEFGPQYIRFWKNDALVGGASPIEVVTPWFAADLQNLQFAQDDESLYIASGTAMVKVLTMTSVDAFTFADLAITGTAGSLPFQGAGNYPRAIAIMDARLYLAGTDNEPNAIWASEPFDFGNFTYYDTISNTSTQIRNPLVKFTADVTMGDKTLRNIAAASLTEMQVGDRIIGAGIIDKDKVTFVGSMTSGQASITNVSSGVIAQLSTGETLTGQGIPSCTILSLSGNTIGISAPATATSNINTMERADRHSYITEIGATYISVTELPTATKAGAALTRQWADPTKTEYHDVTTTRDVFTSSSAFKKKSDEQAGRILWLATGRALIVGTTSGERLVPSGATAINFTIRKQTAIGSAPIQPFMLNEAVLFVESNGRGAREYLYSMAEDAYQSPVLTAIADHILENGVVEMDYQNTPKPALWFTLADGTLAGCSYSRVNQMNAWFRFKHGDGAIESLAVIPNGNGDQVYAAVNRNGARSIECLGNIMKPSHHLDAAAIRTAANGRINGIEWLNGHATITWGEGKTAAVEVTAGEAVLPATISDGEKIAVGIPYTGRIVTMPIQAQAKIGNAQMRDKVITQLNAKVLDSYSFKVGYEDYGMEDAGWVGKKTGNHMIPVQGVWDNEGSVLIEQDKPVDTTILVIAPEVDAGG